MAKANKKVAKSVKAGKSVSKKVQTTLGDLICAAFDATGRNAKAAAKLVSSLELGVSRRIVFV